jgi:hypothetical protein
MPNNIIKTFATKTNKSIDYVESKWDLAKSKAESENHKDDYPYIVSILKTMLGINENILSFDEFSMCSTKIGS